MQEIKRETYKGVEMTFSRKPYGNDEKVHVDFTVGDSGYNNNMPIVRNSSEEYLNKCIDLLTKWAKTVIKENVTK